MRTKEPRTGRCLAIFALVFLCQYALEHAVYMLTDAVYSDSIYMTASVLSVIRTTVAYVIEAIEIFTVAAAALVILLKLVNGNALSALVLAGKLLAVKLIYIVPHYYMTMISGGYDSIEALLWVLLIAAAVLLVMLIELVAAIGVGVLPAVLSARKEERDYRDIIADELCERELWDVGNKATAAMLIASAVLCFKSFVSAVIGAVSFFVAYGTSYSFADIFSVLFNLLYPLILILLAYLVMQYVKEKIMLSDDGSELDSEDDEIGKDAE